MKKIFKTIIILFIATILLESFACASREMMTAKTKEKVGDYVEAAKYLDKELMKNPNNEEAIIMLAKIRLRQNLLKETARILKDAEDNKRIKSKKYLEAIPNIKHRLWIGCYNKGSEFFELYQTSNDEAELDSSIYYNEVGRILRPHLLDWYSRIARAYLLKGDTLKGNKFLDEYTQIISQEIKFGFENSIYLYQDIEEALGKIGASSKAKFDTTAKKNILRNDIFTLDSNNYWFYSYKEADKEIYKIMGWRINLPDDLTDQEKNNWWETSLQPFRDLSYYYYDRKEFDMALKYLTLWQKLTPEDQTVNASIIQIYKNQGKEQVAIDYLKNLSEKNPKNKLYWYLYGDLMFNLLKYDEAISLYDKALAIDPNYDNALRNIASAYKNKASNIQDEEKAILEKDPDYIVKTERYFPFLEKSALYFEKTSITPEFRLNVDVFKELSNIYLVMDKTKELESTIKRIEAIKYKVAPEHRLDLLYNLLKIYSTIKDDQRTNRVNEEIKKLTK